MSKLFDEFLEYHKQIERMNHASVMFYWDMEAGMPEGGFDRHSDALTYLSTEAFKLSTSEELKHFLDELSKPEEYEQLEDHWKFIITKMKEDYERDASVPVDFFSEFVQAQAEAGRAWEQAKNASDFSIFAPHLQRMIDMTKQIAAYQYPGVETYDALLDKYEKGMDSATIDRLFNELKKDLVPLVKQIVAAKQPDDSKFTRSYDLNEQRALEKFLLEYIGFDFKCGGTGETMHPFTLNFSSKDVRVSNHFHENEPLSAIYSAIHEGGHAIFEQNVDEKLDCTAGGSCCYMGIHESQSRFYENILGRNINFWKPIYPEVQKILTGLQDVSLEEFVAEANHVRNSLIRTEADEVTYCLHIIVRYEIEKAIFRDGVNVDALPALWNQKMEEYLGIVPENDAVGILQDMHWSDGSFGYFPSYLLGSIYDGMYLDTITEELGNVDELLAAGKIGEITKWLNEKIHQYGSTRAPKEVIESVCHKEVSAEPIMRYFTEKYTKVYHL